MKVVSLILAAGKGTRMKSELPKVVHKVNGIPMVKKVLNTLTGAGVNENILILGHKIEEVLKVTGETKYCVQKEQLGTGHAVLQAKDVLEGYKGNVLIVCGDTPLIRESTIKDILEIHNNKKPACTILTADFENPFGYGRIVKDENGNVKGIVEEKEADENVKKIKEINTGVYCLDSEKMFGALAKVENKNEKGEYYLTDVIKILETAGEKVIAYKLADNLEVMGINSREQLAEASAVLRDRKNKELMDGGVTLIDPLNTYIEDSVTIGKDSEIHPGVVIRGNTKIGNDTVILGNTRIEDSEIGNFVEIDTSVVEESKIADFATIGPFAHLRPKADIGEKVHVGNFVEVKKAILHKGVKAGHLTYIGDAEIGEGTNIGAGTITCNYDGKNKFKTNIGKGVFVGSDTKFVAPVNVGDNVLIAAGSVITEDIPADALAIARARQMNKEDWNKKESD